MLIGLTGRKQAGKDTVADYLIKHYAFERIAFADPLKQAVANLFGMQLSEVDDFKAIMKDDLPKAEVHVEMMGVVTWSFTWREFLQRFGTEMGRNTFGKDFWVEIWENRYHNSPNEDIVATDVRFENEAERIHYFGGYVIEINRPGDQSDEHASEAGLPEDSVDAWIDNTGTIEDLYRDVDGLIGDIDNGQINRLGISSRH